MPQFPVIGHGDPWALPRKSRPSRFESWLWACCIVIVALAAILIIIGGRD